MKRIIIIIVALISLLVFGDELKVYFADVNQGMGTVIITPSGKSIVVDTNSGYHNVMGNILQNNGIVGSIDYMILTHYHDDHYGGLDEIIEVLDYDVTGACYDRGNTAYGGNPPRSEWTSAAITTTGGRNTPSLGQVIDFGDGVTMTFVHMNGQVYNGGGSVDPYSLDENGLSLGVLISYDNFQLYIGGDCTQPVEKLLGPAMGDIDVYYVNHHGSKTSTAPTFISNARPEVSVFSHGQEYGHPHSVTLDTLHYYNSLMLETEYNPDGASKSGEWTSIANDDIFLTTDGCRYIITGGDLQEYIYDTDDPCSHDVSPPIFAGIKSLVDQGNGGELTLSWDSASDTDNSTPITYNIYMSETSGGQNFSSPTKTTRGESVTFTGLSTTIEYFFVVRAEDYYGNMDDNTVELSAIPLDDIRPPQFAGLISAGSNGAEGEIELSWTAAKDNTPPIIYEIFRSTSVSLNYSSPLLTTQNLGYTDEVEVGSLFYYGVRAVDSLGQSDTNTVVLSATATDDTIPPSFTGLNRVFPTSKGGELLLTWSAAEENSDTVAYAIYRSTSSGGEDFDNPVGFTEALKFYDRSLPWGQEYFYIVRAFDGAGNYDSNTVEESGFVSYYVSETAPAQVHPNPCVKKESVTVTWDKDIVTVSLYDIAGKNRFSERYIIDLSDRELVYDISELASGIYIFHLKSTFEHTAVKVAIVK